MKTTSIKDYRPEALAARARNNHIWLNAFLCVHPTDEFKMLLGAQILKMLEDSDMTDEMGISKIEIFTVNKS